MINITSIIPAQSTLIIGLSGGPDSVCLTTLINQLHSSHKLKIIAAHLDHQWRKDSANDAQWCKQFVQKLNKNIIFEHATAQDFEKNIKYNGSKEAFARSMRRNFFEQLAQKYQANHIVLAHHQDDQLETFFIRLIRGSSTTGAAGMKTKDGLYLRPLLHYSKETILQFLQTNKIDFLHDSTNDNLNFLRNKIRHQLITPLKTMDSRFTANTIRYMNHLQETNLFLDQITEQTMHSIARDKNQYHTDSFLYLSPILQQKIIMKIIINTGMVCTPTQKFFKEIIRFLSKKNSEKTHQITKSHIIIKQNDCFLIKSL